MPMGCGDSSVDAKYKSHILDNQFIFELIRDVKDPELPCTLEEIKVINEDHIFVEDDGKEKCFIKIEFTPTTPHCSLATTLGLIIVTKLSREIMKPFKLEVLVAPGKHLTEHDVNKLINDKERLTAAIENPEIKQIVETCINYQPSEF